MGGGRARRRGGRRRRCRRNATSALRSSGCSSRSTRDRSSRQQLGPRELASSPQRDADFDYLPRVIVSLYKCYLPLGLDHTFCCDRTGSHSPDLANFFPGGEYTAERLLLRSDEGDRERCVAVAGPKMALAQRVDETKNWRQMRQKHTEHDSSVFRCVIISLVPNKHRCAWASTPTDTRLNIVSIE